MAEVFYIDGIVGHNLIEASIRENWKLCVSMYVWCICESEREIYEKASALTSMEAENIPRYAVNKRSRRT